MQLDKIIVTCVLALGLSGCGLFYHVHKVDQNQAVEAAKKAKDIKDNLVCRLPWKCITGD